MNWGWEAIIGEFLVETSRSELRDSLDTNVQGFELLPDDALRHTPAQFLYQTPRTAVLRDRDGVETHTLPLSRERSPLTTALNPSAVDGTTV